MIQIKSPTRVDLAGGTLDCWPLHLMVGDCCTVNLAIDVFTGCELTVLDDSQILEQKKIYLQVHDLNYKREFINLEHLLECVDQEIRLVQKVLDYFKPNFGFRLKTFSQSPVGGGLGGSSSLCISLIRAFQSKMDIQMANNELVHLAHNIEAKVIGTPTGTQDYYPALISGLNIIHYRADGISVERVPFAQEIFKKNMMLIYTGKSHHSGINNWQVIKSVIEGDKSVLGFLKEIARISADTAQLCRQGAWEMLPDLFQQEYRARIKLAPSFSSPEIELLKKIVLDSGGLAVKICGAGGGGCVMVWADSSLHERITQACLKNGFQTLKAQPHVLINLRDVPREKVNLI